MVRAPQGLPSESSQVAGSKRIPVEENLTRVWLLGSVACNFRLTESEMPGERKTGVTA